MGEGVSEKQKGRKKRAYLVHPRPRRLPYPLSVAVASVASCRVVFFALAAVVVVLEGRGTSVVMVEVEVTSWWGLDVLCDTIRQSPGIVDAH